MAKNIITTVRKWLTKLLWLVSLVVIVFVLLISVVKLILPYWLDDKETVVELVEEYIGGEFDYDELVVDWTRFRPTVYLEEMRWKSDDHRIELISSRNTIELNLWKSLLDGYLQTESVEINGVQLSYAINEFESENEPAFSIDSLKLALRMRPEVLEQRKILVRDLTLTLRHQGNSRTLIAPLIRFEKLGNERQLIVDTRSELFSRGRFILESQGQPLADNSEIGIYTALEDTDVKSLAQFLNLDQEFPVDLIDLNLWLTYHGDVPVAGYSQFIASGDQSRIAELKGAIRFTSDEKSFHLSSDQFHLVERRAVESEAPGPIQELVGQELVEEELVEFKSDFFVDMTKNDSVANWTISADNFPIGYLVTSVKPFLTAEHLAIINSIEPDGHINQFQLIAEQTEQSFKPVKADIILSDVSLREHEQIPGIVIDHLSIKDEEGKWRLKLAANNTQLAMTQWLTNPVELDSVLFNGLLTFDQTRVIQVDELFAANADFKLKAEGLVELFETEQGALDAEIAMYAEASDINIAQLHQYWPRKGMKQKALEFLDMSLVGGKVDKAKLILRGGLEAFPYQNGDGQFYVEADVSDAIFKFDPDWPQAEQINAKAIFSNDEMLITSNSGNLLGTTVNKATATIDSFSNEISMLVINVDAVATNESYLALHNQSPLKDDLGDAVTDFTIDRSINPTIEITVPLGNDVPASVVGTIPLNGHKIGLKDYPLELSRVKGTMHFTDDGAYSQNLQGRLWGNVFNIDVKVDDFTEDNDLVKLDAVSNFSVGKVFDANNIQSPLSITGSSELVVRYRVDEDTKQSLIVRTDLKGTTIAGPDWLSKNEQDIADVLVTLFESEGNVLSRAIYRNTISSQLQFSSNNPNDVKGVIALGNLATTKIPSPDNGVAIRGEFNEIKSYDWINSLQFKSGGSFAWPQWINHIDIKTPQLDVAGQKLHDVHLVDELLAGQYLRFKVTAQEGQGSLTFYDDGRKHVVIDKLDITLEPFSKLSDTDIDLEKEALYNWQLECASCRINGIDTGVLTLVTQQTPEGVALQGDSKIEGLLAAYLEGSWIGDTSNIKITFNSPNAGRLLERWGYGDGIKDTRTNGSLNLSWSGGWHQFELVNSNGNLTVDTGQGVVRELSDRQARVFSLFSLQSLRRRLSLDFRDLFEDGFFYDTINGRFTIKEGVVTSERVSINGATADVTITGYTNLVNETVDQNVVVIPKLGSSLPVLAGWAIEPTTGLIMLLINKIFEPVLDVVVRIEYKIKGDLANPEVIELDKKSKEIVVPDEEVLDEIEDKPIRETDLIEEQESTEEDEQGEVNEQLEDDGNE